MREKNALCVVRCMPVKTLCRTDVLKNSPTTYCPADTFHVSTAMDTGLVGHESQVPQLR